MKGLIIVLLLAAIGVAVYYQLPEDKSKKNNVIRIGATVEEVDKALGPPKRVLPQFGGELRVYKLPTGKEYLLIFNNGELVEIQS